MNAHVYLVIEDEDEIALHAHKLVTLYASRFTSDEHKIIRQFLPLHRVDMMTALSASEIVSRVKTLVESRVRSHEPVPIAKMWRDCDAELSQMQIRLVEIQGLITQLEEQLHVNTV